MARTVRGSVTKFNLDKLTDTELDGIIVNSRAQIDSMKAFLATMEQERLRRDFQAVTKRVLGENNATLF